MRSACRRRSTACGCDRARARAILLQVAEAQIGDYARDVETEWKRLTRRYVIEHAQLAPMVTMGFGLLTVSSDNRVPNPPARITAFIIRTSRRSS